MLGTTIYYFLDNRNIADPRLIEPGLADISRAGFDTAYLAVRNTVYGFTDSQVAEACRAACEAGKKLGIKIALLLYPFDTYNLKDRVRFLEKHPDCWQSLLSVTETEAGNGEFQAELTVPSIFCELAPVFNGISRVFIAEKRDGRLSKVKNITDAVQSSLLVEADPDKKTLLSRARLLVRGKFGARGEAGGTVLIYGEFRTTILPDFAAPEARSWCEEVVEKYRGIPLAGVGWDEPGYIVGWDLNCYAGGKHFYEKFSQRFGYDIRDRLYALDYEVSGENTGLVRHQYFSFQRDMLHEAQAGYRRKCEEVFGTGIDVGIHHTWMETDSNDLRHGSLDVFHLGKALTNGYTDSVLIMGEESIMYSTVLARSLGKRSHGGEAYNQSWDFAPKPEELDYYTGLMGLLGVNWFAHAYGDTVFFGPGYPHHPTWEMMPRLTARARGIRAFTAGFEEAPSIALVHTWESVARMNEPWMHMHRYSSMKLAKDSVIGNHPLDIIGTEALTRATVAGKRLLLDRDSYGALVVPWPLVLPPDAWKILKDFAASGGRLLFYGPPALETTGGDPIADEFASLVGARGFGLHHFRYVPIGEATADFADSDCRISEARVDFDTGTVLGTKTARLLGGDEVRLRVYSMEPSGGGAILKLNGRVAGVRSPGGNIYYFGVDIPLFPQITASLLDSFDEQREPHIEVPPGTLWRLRTRTPSGRTGESVFLAIGRHAEPLSGIIRLGSEAIDVRGATFLAAHVKNGKVAKLAADGPHEVVCNCGRISCQRLDSYAGS